MPGIMAKDVLFNDGEGVDFADLNNAQRFLHALIADGVLGALPTDAASTVGHAGMSDAFCYSLGNSGAVYENATGVATPNFAPGLIAQRPATTEPDGNDAQVLLYYLGDNEPSVARPLPATNPRWDIVSVQLARGNADSQTRDFQDGATRALSTSSFNKQRRVNATITWTLGTEAASPVEPATPAGHVKLAAVRVTPSTTLFDPTTDMRDYRMPIGPHRSFHSHNWMFFRDAIGASDYGSQAAFGPQTTVNENSATTSHPAVNFCPVMGGRSRVLKVGVTSFKVSGSPVPVLELQRRNESSSTPAVLLEDVSSLLHTADGVATYNEFDVLGSLGTPLWDNGFAAGYAVERAATAGAAVDATSLGLEFLPDFGERMALRAARWFLAG